MHPNQNGHGIVLSPGQLALLRRVPLFAGLSAVERAVALSLLEAGIHRYGRGEYLHRMGEPLNHFGLVLSGNVQVFTDDFEGNRMMMANVLPGETFGESLCYLEKPAAPVNILSPTESDVMWLRLSGIRAPGADPFAFSLFSRFTAMLAARALDMNERIQILSKMSLREKLCTFLSEWEKRSGKKTFTVPFDRATLAAYLAVNRTALSRELSAMQKEGLIEFYRSSFKILH